MKADYTVHMNYEELMQKAIEASQKSYSPYSKFPVGACILTENENVYSGCNFENASFGLTICAERNAIGSAIVAGEKKIKAIAIYSPNMKNCYPCGACLQVISEFASEDLVIITKDDEGLKTHQLKELFPYSFNL